MKRKSFLSCVLLLAPCLSNAALLQYEFTGEIENLSTTLTSQFSIGDTLSGSYFVNTETFQASNLNVTIGNSYNLTANTGSVSIWDGGSHTDAFIVSFSSGSGISGAPVNGSAPEYFDIQLDFDDLSVLTQSIIPNSLPLDDVWWDRSNINFPSDSERLSYVLTSYSQVSSVPLPASAWLFISGLLGLFSLKRNKANK